MNLLASSMAVENIANVSDNRQAANVSSGLIDLLVPLVLVHLTVCDFPHVKYKPV